MAALASVNTADEVPAGTVRRTEKLEEVKQLILARSADATTPEVGVATGIRGAGGFGKTTLALMLAHDHDIQHAFPDGVLWATIGEDSAGVVQHLNDMTSALQGKALQRSP